MIKPLIIAGFSAALWLTAPALAQPQTDAAAAHAVPVSYADLDLSEEADAQTLLRRLRQAANAACESHLAAQNNARLTRAIAQCREDALTFAVTRLDHPELSRLHTAQRR